MIPQLHETIKNLRRLSSWKITEDQLTDISKESLWKAQVDAFSQTTSGAIAINAKNFVALIPLFYCLCLYFGFVDYEKNKYVGIFFLTAILGQIVWSITAAGVFAEKGEGWHIYRILRTFLVLIPFCIVPNMFVGFLVLPFFYTPSQERLSMHFGMTEIITGRFVKYSLAAAAAGPGRFFDNLRDISEMSVRRRSDLLDVTSDSDARFYYFFVLIMLAATIIAISLDYLMPELTNALAVISFSTLCLSILIAASSVSQYRGIVWFSTMKAEWQQSGKEREEAFLDEMDNMSYLKEAIPYFAMRCVPYLALFWMAIITDVFLGLLPENLFWWLS